METWLIYAILSIFFAGGHSFLVKVATVRNYNASLISVYGYLVGAIIAGAYVWHEGGEINNIKLILFFAFFNIIFYFFSTLSRMNSMRNIDSVIFFPLYKTVSPILVTLSSIFFFSESLSPREFFGIVLGIMVPLLLITTHENTRQKNLKKGVIFLIITSIFVMFSNGFAKGVMLHDINVSFYIFVSMFMGACFSFLSYKYFNTSIKHTYNKEGIIGLGIIMGLFQLLSFYTYVNALTGNLAIVFTLNSFSILIPIVLSIIFYKDHFNLKKGIVIGLSIVSILLFL